MGDINQTIEELKKSAEETARNVADKAVEEAKKQIVYHIRKTRELSFYLWKFAFRVTVFVSIFVLYITNRSLLNELAVQPFFMKVTPLHFLWGVFMFLMICHLIPNNKLSMAWRKARENVYKPVENYDKVELYEHTKKADIRAWYVMLVWLSFNAIFGILYLAGVLIEGDLVMLSIFYFLSDYICILFFCPFQSFIMKNKCCINCRIYDWGHFMMFTPLLFIKNFYSWSLFFTSIVVIIHWEVVHSKYPERFWEGSNETLQCAHCKEKTCQIKRKTAHGKPHIKA